jgi:signal transduction histidine kinase
MPAMASPSVTAARQMQREETVPADSQTGRFQVEVAPLQAVAIDDGRVFIFRRIGINGQIYRQGFVLRLQPFLDHLLAVHYDPQPIARYTRLTMAAAGLGASRRPGDADAGIAAGDWVAGRTFPVPFGFLTAEMRTVSLPPSPARQTLTLALAILAAIMLAGLVAIHRSARTVLDLSERRSQFVSAVTHELKTPLTNIRMYVEMLDQGIAATPEREQEYLGILAAESARLSGLINNVLELSRLEKRTRRFDLKDGRLTDVLTDVQSVMAESLTREGFGLSIHAGRLPVFAYDREVLVQILINLMENSIKFGRHLPEKRIAIAADAVDGWVKLAVSDTGPGIPKRSLKQVFDDFYRVDNDLTRTTGGTGLGLALVKKFIVAMGGRVRAENNDGPGCTITISLPANRQR